MYHNAEPAYMIHTPGTHIIQTRRKAPAGQYFSEFHFRRGAIYRLKNPFFFCGGSMEPPLTLLISVM